jgi:hypothetical protein
MRKKEMRNDTRVRRRIALLFQLKQKMNNNVKSMDTVFK